MGALKTLVIIIAIVVVILAITGGYIYYKAKDLTKISVEDPVIRIRNVTSGSFIIEGEVAINNPSKTNLPLKEINYDVILEDTNEVMASGQIPATTIKEQDITTLSFSQEVIIPSSATQLISQENIFALIKAQITVDYPIARNYPIPLEQKIDIKPYIEQQASQIPSDLLQ